MLVTFPDLQFSLMVRAWLILLRVRTCSCVCVCMQKYEYVWKGLQGESVSGIPGAFERPKRAQTQKPNDHIIISFIHSFILLHCCQCLLSSLLPMFVIYVFIVILHYYYVWFILGVDPSHCLPLSCGKLETPKQNVGQWGFAAGIIWPNLRGRRNKQMV